MIVNMDTAKGWTNDLIQHTHTHRVSIGRLTHGPAGSVEENTAWKMAANEAEGVEGEGELAQGAGVTHDQINFLTVQM